MAVAALLRVESTLEAVMMIDLSSATTAPAPSKFTEIKLLQLLSLKMPQA